MKTDCDATWDLARRWLQGCNSTHETCTNLDTQLPTRLVKVDEDGKNIQLVLSESLEVGVQYVTLSHCWGSKSFKMLTKESYDEFVAGMSCSSLSKTFREAITATRRL